MKKTCLLLFCLSFSYLAYSQLDNTSFYQQLPLNEEDSGRFTLGVNGLGFTKNNEYFNRIVDGYTLFGYQVNPYLNFQPLKNVTLNFGLYLQKDFGSNGYEEIAPTFSFKYKHDEWNLIFGTLEGAYNHNLIEPLYDFEKGLINRLENGVQIYKKGDRFDLDLWVDWQHMLYRGENDQEEVVAGLSTTNRIIDNESFRLSIPFQLMVYHKGGQIDTSPLPIQTLVNVAPGIKLEWMGWNGWITGAEFQGYFLADREFAPARTQFFEDGIALYLNAALKTKFDLTVMASYWKAHEFISIQGGLLYPTFSSVMNDINAVDRNRELLILRFLHEMKLSENIALLSRIEPHYIFSEEKLEFYNAFYVTYRIQKGLGKR